MPKISFRGRIIPEVSDITLHVPPSLRWLDEPDYCMEFRLTIEHSEITVECTVSSYDRGRNFDAIHMRALDIAEAATNFIAFSAGMGVSIVLDTFTDPNGKTTSLLLHDQPLQALVTFAEDEKGFTRTLELVLQEPRLYRGFRDLVHAIRVSSQIPSSCGSAMEAIRVLVVPADMDRNKSWPLMRKALNLDEAYLKLVTDHYVGPRHGDHKYVPGTVTREIASRAWTVMNRFLVYLQRGRQPLPIDEFPMLKG